MSAEQELIDLSGEKWRWMTDKNVNGLDNLFHEQSVFVHMGGAWGKGRELGAIEQHWNQENMKIQVSFQV